MNNAQKKWIDNADYEALLKRWRFSDSSDTIFHDDCGRYYAKVMAKKKALLSGSEVVSVSKCIGWEP